MLEHLYFPHDISTFGPRIDWLFELIFWIVMVVWIAVMIAMVVFMVRYRTGPAARRNISKAIRGSRLSGPRRPRSS